MELCFDVVTREELGRFSSDGMTHTQYVKVSVSDKGNGIPEEQLEKVSERYYQLDNQTRGTYNWGNRHIRTTPAAQLCFTTAT